MADIALQPRMAKPQIREATSWDQLKTNRNWLGFWFMLPAMAFLIFFLAYPLGLGIWISFTDARIGRPGEFIGTENYEWLWGDSIFWLSVFNTLLYTGVASAIKFAVGLYLALLLNENMPFKAMLRAMVLIPFIVPTVLSALAFWWIFDAQFSIISWSLKHLGLITQNINFLGDVTWARGCVIFVNIWRGVPFVAITLLAGLQTVLTLHDAARIGHPNARWGVCEGNPVHDDVRAAAAATHVDFALDVILNRDKEIVAAFGGDLLAMHAAARAVSGRLSMAPVPAPFDVVVTTNSGFPLDQNLYQSVKGMSAAATIVKPGGLIVCAAECRDGFPDHGSYREVLASAASPSALLAEIESRERTVPDQWQVQLQAKVQTMADVGVYSSFISDDDLRAAHLEPVHDVAAAVDEALAARGPSARVCVLPEGPQTIPYLA